MISDDKINELNDVLSESWLGSSVEILDFNPPRTENNAPRALLPGDKTEPMNRFVFRDDAFTALDGEILNNNEIRIIYNSYLKGDNLAGHYEWDAAFAFLKPETVVTIDQIKKAIENYVVISNNRFKLLRGEGDPVPHPEEIRYDDETEKVIAEVLEQKEYSREELFKLWINNRPHFGGHGPHRYDGTEQYCSYCGRPKNWK